VSGGPGPRLAPLPRAEWGEDARDALRTGFSEAVAARFCDGDDSVPVPNVLGTLMHHPALAGPFLAYNNVLLQRPLLEPRTRELAILRVAWRTRAGYEWAQHARIAAGLGVGAEEIDALADRGSVPWSPLDAAVIDAVDELVDAFRVADATWARLAAHLDERRLVELVFVVGTYTGLAMAFNSFGLELDADLRSVAMPSDAEEE